MRKTKLEAIRQMSNEELAFFLSIVQWNDLNCIHLMPKEDIDHFKKYLNEDGEELIESVHYILEDWKSYNFNTLEEEEAQEDAIDAAQTVEAIPKDQINKAIEKIEQYICDVETDTVKAQGMAQALDMFEQTLGEVEEDE